jgi:hypothetical protein
LKLDVSRVFELVDKRLSRDSQVVFRKFDKFEEILSVLEAVVALLSHLELIHQSLHRVRSVSRISVSKRGKRISELRNDSAQTVEILNSVTSSAVDEVGSVEPEAVVGDENDIFAWVIYPVEKIGESFPGCDDVFYFSAVLVQNSSRFSEPVDFGGASLNFPWGKNGATESASVFVDRSDLDDVHIFPESCCFQVKEDQCSHFDLETN